MRDLMLYEGGNLSYEIFISFVRDILGPCMQISFIEEDFYYELWRDFYQIQNSSTEIARGHGKSEFLIWVAVYDAVYRPINKFSGKRIYQHLIASADATTTQELNQRIAQFFFDVPELKQFLPSGIKKETKNTRWNSNTFEFRNKHTIHFRQIKCKRGLHVDRISIDDPTTESSTLTDKQTNDFVMGAILPMGTVKEAIVSFTGTPLRLTDIFTTLEKTGVYSCKKMPAIMKDGKLLSNKFTQASLDKIKKVQGSTKFACEYLLNPIDDSVSLIKRVWITQCYDTNYQLTYEDFDEIYLGVDFAFSDRTTADHSAFVDVGLMRDGENVEYHLLNYRREKGKSITEQMTIVALMYANIKYQMIGFEENSIKSYSKDIKEMGLPIKMFWTGNRDQKDKVDKDPTNTTHSISKTNAIQRMGISFENRRWVIPYTTDKEIELADTMTEELTSWALDEGKIVEVGRHPDGPMALIMAMEVLNLQKFVVI